MPDLNFTVDRAEPLPHAAAPLLIFKLRITEAVADGSDLSRGVPHLLQADRN